MKKFMLAAAVMLPLALHAQDKKAPKTLDLLVGGYTTDNNKAIYVYRFYTETGRLAYLNQSDEVANPSYLCVDKDGKHVYAVSETGTGEVYAYNFSGRDGQLTFINKQPTGGNSPCYVSIDEDSKHIFVANYGSGSFAAIPLKKDDGSLGTPAQLIQNTGSSIDKDRQGGPHAHGAFVTPDGKYVLVTDLGIDKIIVERYKHNSQQPLAPASPATVSVTPGSGPRHIDFSPDKKHAYLVQEMAGTVTAFDYDNGKLKQIQSVTMLRDGFNGRVGAADIHVSPDGKFLYASNRGDANEIVVYAINRETGMLTFIDRTAVRGKNPRNFVIDPTGAFLLVANQDSNNINVFKRDKATGKLAGMIFTTQLDKPVCLKFAPAM